MTPVRYILTTRQRDLAEAIAAVVKRDERPHFVRLAMTCVNTRGERDLWTMSVPGMEAG